jgi:hypothetical protein
MPIEPGYLFWPHPTSSIFFGWLDLAGMGGIEALISDFALVVLKDELAERLQIERIYRNTEFSG